MDIHAAAKTIDIVQRNYINVPVDRRYDGALAASLSAAMISRPFGECVKICGEFSVAASCWLLGSMSLRGVGELGCKLRRWLFQLLD